jgi:NAD(P)-dependent dehydrogenase (short-subunit alcohol dehydrogenase family)
MAIRIEGTVALVTGANRGIGLALAEALVEAGAKKVYAGTREPGAVDALVKRYPGRVVALRLDVTRPAEVANAAAEAGDVRVLINNAGVAAQAGAPFVDAAWLEAGRREMDVNVFGTLSVTQAFAPVLARNGGGAVVNIVSVAGLSNFPLLASYSASKAALHSITQASRLMLKGQGTYVSGVYPGPVDTDMAAKIPSEKTPPVVVARAVLAGLERGDEEIFPDEVARQLGTTYLKDPKALELQIGNMIAA